MTTMAMSKRMAGGDSLEVLVDRLMEVVLGQDSREAQSVARSVHDARRMRRAGDLGGALAVLGGVKTQDATEREVRWVHSEWMGLARRRFAGSGALIYGQGTGRAAVLLPRGEEVLSVAAAVGMRWQPGKLLSRRSLRGLRNLDGSRP